MLRRRFFGNKSGAPDESGGSRVLDESGPARPALWRRNNISRAPVDRTEKAETSQLSTEENRHDFLANELLRLTSSMKQNFTVAGTVIREDNETLSAMQNLADSNRHNLDREGKRLEHHAYKSCFECTMLLTVIFIIWSFIAMIIVMKVFPKRV